MEKRAFVTQNIPFVEFNATAAPPYPVEVVPSFYYVTGKTAYTTVRITAPNLDRVTSVASVDRYGPCAHAVQVEGGFTCQLPHAGFPSSVDYDAPHEYIIKTPLGNTRFTLQPLREDGVTVTAASPATISTGRRLEVKLSAPLETALLLPWVPVLVLKDSGNVEHAATFTNVAWSDDKMSLSATFSCLACRPAAYDVYLGEAVQGQAAAVIHVTAATVNVVHRTCGDIVLPALPRDVLQETLATGAVQLYLPVSTGWTAHTRVVAHAGDKFSPLAATMLPAAGSGRGILAVTPPYPLKTGATTLTLSEIDETGRYLSTCVLANAFSVNRTVQYKPVIKSVSQRLFFAGDGYAEEETVIIRGDVLLKVRSVVLHFVGGDEQPNGGCSDVELNPSGGYLTCTLHKSATASRGKFDFVLADQYGMYLAKVDGFYLLDGPSATFAGTGATVGTLTTVSAALSRPFPDTIPVELVLMHADNTPVAVSAQWIYDDTVVFVDAPFVSSGTAYIAYRELSASNVTLTPIPGLFNVASGPRPVARLAAVYPSHLQSSTLDGVTPTTLHLDIPAYNLAASQIDHVAVGPLRARIVSQSGGLHVSVLLSTTPQAYDIVVYDKAGNELAALRAGVTVEADADGYNGPIALINSNYISAVDSTAQIASLKMLVRNGPANWSTVNITSSLGNVVRFNVTGYEDMDHVNSVGVWVECMQCLFTGDQVTLTYVFPGALPIHTSFMLLREHVVYSVWAPAVLDFTAVPLGACVPFALTLKSVNLRVPLALGLLPAQNSPHSWTHAGVKAVNYAVDEATRTFTGCFVCENCVEGTFTVALTAAYTDANAMSKPTIREMTIVPPGATYPKSGGNAVTRAQVAGMAGNVGVGKPTDMDGLTMGLIVSLSAAAAVAVAGLLYRRLRRASEAPTKTATVSHISDEASIAETPYSAI